MKYRQDIDGLRAIAVMAVVLFHFGVSTLSGGYAGVDVFFVISGFLISSILMNDVESKQFSFTQFYEKRVRRLFPALFATILVSTLVSYVLFMPEEFREFGQSVIGATTYLSNVFFWLKSDYFEGPSELKPLLHTWSLSVEEQFYLIFPILVWLCYKISFKFFIYFVVICFITSFISAVYFIDSMTSAVFFLSPFRFWELLLGTLVAILLKNKTLPNENVAPFLAGIGIIMIIAPLFLLDKTSIFPGWAAVPSCLGTALIIWANNQNIILGRILSQPIMQFTGKISYSMYLWHWPVVVFYGYWIIRELVWWDTIALIIFTYLISWLSWRLFEVPFRFHKDSPFKPKLAFTLTAGFTGLAALVGLVIWQQQGLPQRFPELQTQILAAKTERKNNVGSACFIQQDQFFNKWDRDACYFPLEGASKTLLLWGDSHAFHLLRGLKHHQSEIGANILVYASAGCSPLLHTDIPRNPQCRANNDNVVDMLSEYKIDNIIMAGNWAWAFKVEDENADLSAVRSTFNTLQERGYNPLVVNQLPIYAVKNPQYLAMRLSSSDKGPNNYYLAPDYGTGASKQIKSIMPKYNLFNPQDVLCPDVKCSIYLNKEIMVSDEAHLSNAGSNYIVGEMLIALKTSLNSNPKIK
jgi:peptidoglycan/LPS O-acetylase OafA/YrhL